MFIFRAVLDALTELLSNESRKVRESSSALDYAGMQAAAREAEAEAAREREAENKKIEEAKRQLAAQGAASAENAKVGEPRQS